MLTWCKYHYNILLLFIVVVVVVVFFLFRYGTRRKQANNEGKVKTRKEIQEQGKNNTNLKETQLKHSIQGKNMPGQEQHKIQEKHRTRK